MQRARTSTNRLDRRLTILRGKRQGAFDTDQYYLERARRTRFARRIRSMVRRMEPVILVTPRWSRPGRFLDELSTDLQIGTPAVSSMVLDLYALRGRDRQHVWAFLLNALATFCGERSDQAILQPVHRDGFRSLLATYLEKCPRSSRRCLMLHGTQHVDVEILSDLIEAFRTQPGTGINPSILLAGSVKVSSPTLPERQSAVLPDYSEIESVEVLVEFLGPIPRDTLDRLVEYVGGVPALLDFLGTADVPTLQAVQQIADIWPQLGPLAIEIRGAYEILVADDALFHRLEELAKSGPLAPDNADRVLLRSGLVREHVIPGGDTQTHVRSPLFAELALAG